MDLVRWDPFNGLDRIQSRINEFFDEALGHSRMYPTSATARGIRPWIYWKAETPI